MSLSTLEAALRSSFLLLPFQALVDEDPLAGEQTWPTEEEEKEGERRMKAEEWKRNKIQALKVSNFIVALARL